MIIYLKTTRGVGRIQVTTEEAAAALEATKRWERYEPSPPPGDLAEVEPVESTEPFELVDPADPFELAEPAFVEEPKPETE